MSEEDVRCAIASAVPVAPQGKAVSKSNGRLTTLKVELLSGAALMPEPIRWLWDGWLAHGKLHLLAGMAGTGKTTIAISFAAAVTTGGPWPDGSRTEPGDVLVWSGEDDFEDTLLPRFLASGGDPARVYFVRSIKDDTGKHAFDPANDMSELAGVAEHLPALKLLIVDPVVAAVSGDSHKNAETRRGLQPLVELAAELDCAVLGITHFTKNTSGREPIDRVTGSLAFAAAARIVLAASKGATPSAPRRLVRVKSNLGPDVGGFEYDLFQAPVPGHMLHAQRIGWGAQLQGAARELLEVEKADGDGGALKAAVGFLAEFLKDGPVQTKEIEAAAKAHGITVATLRRAKDKLGVVVTKSPGKHAPWQWQLPDHSVASAVSPGIEVTGEA